MGRGARAFRGDCSPPSLACPIMLGILFCLRAKITPGLRLRRVGPAELAPGGERRRMRSSATALILSRLSLAVFAPGNISNFVLS
jgi:hypothetical protein